MVGIMKRGDWRPLPFMKPRDTRRSSSCKGEFGMDRGSIGHYDVIVYASQSAEGVWT